jgi:hypothetical protein
MWWILSLVLGVGLFVVAGLVGSLLMIELRLLLDMKTKD